MGKFISLAAFAYIAFSSSIAYLPVLVLSTASEHNNHTKMADNMIPIH